MSESFDAPPTAAETQAAGFDTPPTAEEQGFEAPPTADEVGAGEPAIPNLGVRPLSSREAHRAALAAPPTAQDTAPGAYTLGGPDITAWQAHNGALPSQAAADALKIARDTGLDHGFVADNLDAMKAQAGVDKTARALAGAPAVAAYAGKSAVHAAAVKESVGPLEALEQGLLDLGYSFAATFEMSFPSAEMEKTLLGSEAETARYEGKDSPWYASAIRNVPTLAAFYLSGAGGMGLGGKVGEVTASTGLMYLMNRGSLYRKIMQQMPYPASDEEGIIGQGRFDQVAYEQRARTYATAGAGASAALATGIAHVVGLAVPGAVARVNNLSTGIIARAFTDPATRDIINTLIAHGGEWGGHTLSGALAMAVPAVIDDATVQQAARGNIDPQKAAEAGWEAFKHSLITAGVLSAAPHVVPLVRDIGRIRRAPEDAGRLDHLVEQAKAAPLTKQAPQEAKELIGEMAQASDTPTVHVDPEALAKNDAATTKLVESLADEGRAIAEARATGTDVQVPVENYLADMTEHHESLRPDVKLDPLGMTPREAETVKSELSLTALLAQRSWILQQEPDTPARTAKLEKLAADMRFAAVTKPIPETEVGGAGVPQDVLEMLMQRYGGTGDQWRETITPENIERIRQGLEPAEAKPPPPMAPSEMEIGAAKMLEGKTIAQLQPGRYKLAAQTASNKIARMAEAAVTGPAAGVRRPGEARSLEQTVRLAELTEARDRARAAEKRVNDLLEQAEKDRAFLLRYTKPEARAELGKAKGGHLEAADLLLSGFEFGQGATRKDVARRQGLMQWIESERAQNRDPIIPDSIMAKLDRFVHWKDLTPEEMRDLRQSIESIARQAELKNTILEKRARVDRENGMKELAASAFANMPDRPVIPEGAVIGKIEKGAIMARKLGAGLERPEIYIRALDGGKIDGPWHRYLWDPIKDTKHGYYDLLERVARPIVDEAQGMPAADKKRWLTTRYQVNGIDFDLKTAIAVMANRGSASNERKMVEGWQQPSVTRRGMVPWNEGTADQFTTRLKRGDVDMVQRIWDQLESMWEDVAELEKRSGGVEPEKVPPRPFDLWFDKDGNQVPSGTAGAERVNYRGGYYPVIYDPTFSAQGERGAAEAKVGGLFDPAYPRIATPQGHLQKRIEGFSRPVLLSIDALPRKINGAVKDTTMREALISVHSILTDDRMRAVMQRTIGREGEKVLQNWVLEVANDHVIPDNGAGPWIERLNASRNRFTTGLFAFNIAQTLQNLAGVAPAVASVGPLRYAAAIKRIAQDRAGTIGWINENSGEMRSRSIAALPGVADALRELGQKQGLGARFSEFGLEVFESTDKAVAYPLWLAEYDRAVEGGTAHDVAVKLANEKVRLKLMASGTEDMPALLRSKLGKMLAPLYGYANNRLNAFFDVRTQARAAQTEGVRHAYAKKLAAVWGTFAAEVILSDLYTGKGPKDINDDDKVGAEDVAVWLGLRSLLAPVYLMPIVGSMARSLESGRDVTLMPETQILTQTVKATRAGAHIVGRTFSEDQENSLEDLAFQRDLAEIGLFAAYGTGLPASQIRTTSGYLMDENQPKDDPLQIGLGTAFGKKRPGKLLDLVSE